MMAITTAHSCSQNLHRAFLQAVRFFYLGKREWVQLNRAHVWAPHCS